jgi:hypothetical protein
MKLAKWLAVVFCLLVIVDLQVRAFSAGPPAYMSTRGAPLKRPGVKVLQFDLALEYGSVALGQNLVKSQTLNTLCDFDFCFPIDYDVASIHGDHVDDFDLIADSCSGASVGTGSSCTMSIRFTPSAAGARSAYLFLDSSAGNAPLILTLTGSGSVELDPDYLGQGAAPWGEEVYDHSTRKIKNLGCALTSLAMALGFAGVDTDPGLLNQELLAGNGYAGTSVNWDPAVRAASDGELAFYQRRELWSDPDAEEFLNAALSAGYPVVVGVNLDASNRPRHFVLVTGYANGQYLINDPGYSGRTTLADYNGRYVTRGAVIPTSGPLPNASGAGAAIDVSGLNVAVNQNASVLLTDGQGRRTGYDSVSQVERAEIPASAHFQDGIDDDVDPVPAATFADGVGVFQPAAGTYSVRATGASAGLYAVTVHPFRSDGTSQGSTSFPGISGPGGVLSVRVQLATQPGGTSTITRQASFAGTVQNIATCRAQGLITKQQIAKTLTQAVNKAARARTTAARKAALKKYMTTLTRNSRSIAASALPILQQDGTALQTGNIVP